MKKRRFSSTHGKCAVRDVGGAPEENTVLVIAEHRGKGVPKQVQVRFYGRTGPPLKYLLALTETEQVDLASTIVADAVEYAACVPRHPFRAVDWVPDNSGADEEGKCTLWYAPAFPKDWEYEMDADNKAPDKLHVMLA